MIVVRRIRIDDRRVTGRRNPWIRMIGVLGIRICRRRVMDGRGPARR